MKKHHIRNDNRPHQCCGRILGHDDCHVGDLHLTPVETRVLTAARYFFESFAHPAGYPMDDAILRAGALFEEGGAQADSPRIVARILAMLEAIRCSRRSVFVFNPTGCPTCAAIASDQERRMMLSLIALGQGHRSRAWLETMILCEGNDVDAVLWAMEALVQALPTSDRTGTFCPQAHQ